MLYCYETDNLNLRVFGFGFVVVVFMGRGHRVTHMHLSIKVTDSFQIFLSLMSHPNYAQESLNFVVSKQNHGYIYFIVNHLINRTMDTLLIS